MLTGYNVPLDDIRFALAHLAGESNLPSDEEATLLQILTEAGRFAIERLIPLNLAGDRIGTRLEGGEVITPPGFAEAYRDWAEAGWMGVSTPESWGGSGLAPLVTAALDEIWNGANMSFYVCPTLTQAALKLILAHGSEAQKQAYVPNLASGRWTASMGLTEPQAGSDLSLITTRAEPAGGGRYLLRGAKIFTSFGEHGWTENILHLVLARIDGAPPGSRGISLFIVPKMLGDGRRNDAYCTGVEHKLGLRASPTCVMAYGTEDGALGELLGAANAGLSTMFVMMNKARIACALQSVGLAERALQQAQAYAAGRPQGRGAGGTVAIAAHPDVKRMLLRMAALTQAARAITYTAVAAVEAEPADAGPGGRGGLLTPIAKVFASESACEITGLNIQVHGGMGYVEETGASQFLRDARAIPIYEGTNGIQAIDLVQRKLIPDGGAALARELDLLRLHAGDAAALAPLEGYAARLSAAIGAVERAARWLLDPARPDPERLAAAFPFIALVGATLAGGYLARGLVSAFRAEGAMPPGPLRATIFYGNAILTAAHAQAEDVTASAFILA
ncbi:MAG: 3-(methylsulfanyl)propanoyl-CoA dehydrogenase [Sphingomonadales bacterium]|jgi:alkylation response protein AidB-like acyl-CoA dehydrogenase|nr:3-(methylsulfanyl)propanoyl-CoA dehydrogenase [Sphingomonadales bacterium]